MNTSPAYHLSDKHLAEKILRGDNGAFGQLVRDTEGLVASIVCKLIDHAEDRRDIVQDVYMKVFDKLEGFRFQSKLSTWIGQIAYNTCLSWIEKKKPLLAGSFLPDRDPERYRDGFPDRSSMPGSHAEDEPEMRLRQKELASILRTEIGNLPPVYQLLIGLYHQQDCAYEEMALIAGLPVGTVKSYLFRARKMLKENLLSKYKKEAL